MPSVNADAVAFLLLAFVVSRVVKILRGLKAVDGIPGFRCALSARSPFGALFNRSMHPIFFNPGTDFLWQLKDSLYDTYDVISLVPFVHGPPAIFISSWDTARQITGHTAPIDKPFNVVNSWVIFGENVVTSQTDIWKRHRRIVAPAFSQKTHELVWVESIRTYNDMSKTEGWETQDFVGVPVINHITHKFAYSIISTCAFGLPFSWDESATDTGATMSTHEAIGVAALTFPLRALYPQWVYYLPFKSISRIEQAYSTLDSFMRTQVTLRNTETNHQTWVEAGRNGSQNDVFSRIVQASQQGGKLALDEREVIGNTFLMLFAGHETTAHSLAATVGLLGVYQEEQEIAYQQIQAVLADGREPTLEDFGSLDKVLNCFLEGLRLFPAAAQLAREATEDIVLKVRSNKPGIEDREMVLKKGAHVHVDVIGINYNPRNFPDPKAFKPSRWANKNLENDHFGFGHGPRSCLGRKFALYEAICFLSLLLRDWKVEVALRPGETREEWRQRVMTGKVETAFAPSPIPVNLRRRV
ncbi:hypothetical protein BOTBODRAFT_110044 [Botryobasidium botryosum FD-172 SS1]|uniref:Cytochrome P450 n=1 Tax=Botryobasidium botryosum (strain FD-172 SS1) TaxID=930990 RepID=A0A067MRR5_BOTB1|nr:hypothetical protein BOTBODRAFT_110044 [Botryobasidium botryosum FD-172 SS1]